MNFLKMMGGGGSETLVKQVLKMVPPAQIKQLIIQEAPTLMEKLKEILQDGIELDSESGECGLLVSLFQHEGKGLILIVAHNQDMTQFTRKRVYSLADVVNSIEDNELRDQILNAVKQTNG